MSFPLLINSSARGSASAALKPPLESQQPVASAKARESFERHLGRGISKKNFA